MIYNKRKMPSGKVVNINPTPKQNKYLLQIGAEKEYGQDWNGFGWANKIRVYSLTANQTKKYNEIGKLGVKKAKQLSQAEKTEKWAKRLSKLTGVSLEESTIIAEEKLEYHQEKIDEMIDRDCQSPSVMRGRLIAKMERENPLRRIECEEHAQRILAASRRHKESNYEAQLEEGRELAEFGQIERGEVRDFARRTMQYS